MKMRKHASERGSALLLVTVITLIIVGISGAYVTVSHVNAQKAVRDADGLKALYIAESAAALLVNHANHPPANPTAPVRPIAVDLPQQFAGGSYLIPTLPTVVKTGPTGAVSIAPMNPVTWAAMASTDGAKYDFVDFQVPPPGLGAGVDDNYIRMRVYGTYNGVTRKVEVLVSRAAGGAFWNAVYAGNSSNDPNYTLGFNGTAAAPQNDQVTGDMYSGRNFSATGSTVLQGDGGPLTTSTITYANANSSTISGPTYKQGTQDPLNLMNKDASGNPVPTPWETKAAAQRSTANRTDADGVKYIDVAYDLETKGSAGNWGGSTGAGGYSTKQITNVNEPAHIFRKNPSSTSGSTTDRTNKYEFAAHAKNDYYLEDPTSSGPNTNTISVPINGDTTASAINVNAGGNNAVYFIDGNMRVSGEPTKSYQWTPAAGTGNLQMTVIVKGNVSMTDNMLYPTYQSKNDAVAIIAITDPAFPNKAATDFGTGSNYLSNASGFTVDQFVADYNSRTQAARNAGLNIPAMPTNVSSWSLADRERAAQEYNKAYGSGNVYFGDPGSGTVEHFEGFLYAENNFYATNLDSGNGSGGTQKVELFGNMTAGNQVKIVRTLSGGGYIPLKVTFDDVIRAGTVRPPSLPSTPSSSAGAWYISNSKQVP